LNYTQISPGQVTPYSFDREHGIVGMMDCGGSNLAKIRRQLGDDIVKVLATSRALDDERSSVVERAEEFGVPIAWFDFSKYEAGEGVVKGDYKKFVDGRHDELQSDLLPDEIESVREEACYQLAEKIQAELEALKLPNIPFFAAGFMALLSPEFVDDRYILNIHPADLGYKENGVPLLAGDAWKPSRKAMELGHTSLCSTMHRMEPEMDQGAIHMRGYKLVVEEGVIARVQDSKKEGKRIGKLAQEALKHLGDHVVAGASFMDLFKENWGQAEDTLCYKMKGEWMLVPEGITIDDHVKNNPSSPFFRDEEFIQRVTDEFHRRVRE